MVEFKPLSVEERSKLGKALLGNAENGTGLLMDRNTSFVGTDNGPDYAEEEKMIMAIKSVPCHY